MKTFEQFRHDFILDPSKEIIIESEILTAYDNYKINAIKKSQLVICTDLLRDLLFEDLNRMKNTAPECDQRLFDSFKDTDLAIKNFMEQEIENLIEDKEDYLFDIMIERILKNAELSAGDCI